MFHLIKLRCKYAENNMICIFKITVKNWKKTVSNKSVTYSWSARG